MKQKHLLICLLTALLPATLGASAQAATITVEVIATFDYPGAASTEPRGINNNKEIAGSFSVGSVTRGFTRTADGQFSAPIIAPSDTHNFTSVDGLNNSGTVCGFFFGDDDHGFFFSDGSYTQYDVPGSSGTAVLGVNDADDFVGYYYTPEEVLEGFVSIGGAVTTIEIPGGFNAIPIQLNTANQVVGSYVDTASGITSGFYSSPTSKLVYPIHVPGSLTTTLNGINDRGWMVGSYSTQSGRTGAVHGLLFIAPNQFVTVDYPGSSYVVLTGINHKGLICGWYLDSNNKVHGLVARAQRTAE
jgi:hypothetical protein